MPRIDGTTNMQTKFLRAFRDNPHGSAESEWPSTSILRRWLKRDSFVRAMKAIYETATWRADFRLASTAAAAAGSLHTAVTSDNVEAQLKTLAMLANLVKLAHTRERFLHRGHVPRKRVAFNDSSIELMHPSLLSEKARIAIDTLKQKDAA